MARRRLLVAALAAALVAGCFEEPIREQLRLRFDEEGALTVSLRIDLVTPEGKGDNQALAARFAATERELLAGEGAWARRFAALGGVREGQSFERREGRLAWFEQWAESRSAERLADFFADTPVQALYRVEVGRDGLAHAELVLEPGSGRRATVAEAREAEVRLAPWLAAVTHYEASAWRLWRYLDRRPDRRRACLGSLLGGLGEDEQVTLSQPEEGLVNALEEAQADVADALQLADGEAETLEELVRRVHDPFPARLQVEVSGTLEAAEGFRRAGEGWEVPPRGLWEAFAALDGRWVSPDPLLATVTRQRAGDGKPLDLDAYLARPWRRGEGPPSEGEVRERILGALHPEESYRLAWVLPAPPEDPDTSAAAAEEPSGSSPR